MPGSQAIDQSTPAEPGFSARSSLYLYVCFLCVCPVSRCVCVHVCVC